MDLSSTSNWSLIYEQTLSGPNISTLLVPAYFSSEIIGIYVSTSSAKATWFTGGWINQLVETNLITSTTPWISFSQRLYLGGNVVIFPRNFVSYQLQFSFPVWLPNAFISIWAYVEPS